MLLHLSRRRQLSPHSLALAVLPLSLAAPAPVPETITWIPFDEINGQTIYQNSAIIAEASLNFEKEAVRSLERRAPDNDTCDGATVNSHPQPFANTADCAALCDWAAGQTTYWTIRTLTPDSHGLWYLGTCVFEAGTENAFLTWVGSTNMRDIMTWAIDKWQSGGVVASTGETHCENKNGGIPAVKWTVKHS
ncbi:hypothetical protein DE146DRAFT_741568 [Phaeosphaeria sp. MPI-PUGE-AT-0046c]|nr:hypothetical protein DE146DRAFT_741568 [Phaeosphaeria sp. MPI-PUGE-AT-0046c]